MAGPPIHRTPVQRVWSSGVTQLFSCHILSSDPLALRCNRGSEESHPMVSAG